MTIFQQCSTTKGWAMVALCAIVALGGCAPAMGPQGHRHDPFGDGLLGGMFGPAVPASAYTHPMAAANRQRIKGQPVSYRQGQELPAPGQDDYPEGLPAEGVGPGLVEHGYADGGYVDGFYEPHADGGCFECGPGHPGPLRRFIHELFHHRQPVRRTVRAAGATVGAVAGFAGATINETLDFLLCPRCGGNANMCGCGGGPRMHHPAPTHGLLEKPPIAVDRGVGPCWGVYQTAWRRFPPHCPNQPTYYAPQDPLVDPLEGIPPGVPQDAQNGSSTGGAGPQLLPTPTDGNVASHGFHAPDGNQNERWRTAGRDNPLRGESGETRTAWKPATQMSWLPLRTADERNWRRPNEEGNVIR